MTVDDKKPPNLGTMTADELAAWAKKQGEDMERSWESDKLEIECWYEDARKVSNPTELLAFFDKLNEFSQNYNTIPCAIAAGAVAAATMLDRWMKQGGISGFQGGHVMWQFIQKWMHFDGPLRLVEYKHMLFPQYEQAFEKTIDKDTWVWLQAEAKKKLAKDDDDAFAADSVVEHWRSIAKGKVPFGYRVVERR